MEEYKTRIKKKNVKKHLHVFFCVGIMAFGHTEKDVLTNPGENGDKIA